jgi:hypothetical protein
MAGPPTIHIAQYEANLTDAGIQSDPAVIDIGLGRYIVTWDEAAGGPIATAGGTDVVGQIFDHAGNRIGNEFRLNSNFFGDDEQDAALAARPGGGFFMVYEDTDSLGTTIRSQTYDANGNLVLSGPFTIQNDTNDDTLSNPTVAMRSDGSYLVAYNRLVDADGKTDLVGRVVSAAGSVGAEFLIAADGLGSTPTRPSSAMSAATSSCSGPPRQAG